MLILDFVSWLAGLSTVCLYLTGISICRKIVRKGNSSESPFFPLVVMFCNTTLWVKYALIKGDHAMLYANLIGSVLTLFYVIFYYVFTLHKGSVHKQLLFGFFLLFPILIYVKFSAANQDIAIAHLGLVCAAVGVLGYGAPLSSVAEVIRTKSTECMAFPLSVANTVVAVEWFIYGYLLFDKFLMVPNLIGLILGCLQLSLFCIYPSKRSIIITSAS